MNSSSGSGCGGATSDPTSPPSAEKPSDGWDNEEWGSLEEEPEPETQPPTREPSAPRPNSGWEDTEFEPVEENTSVNYKLEEARKKREERKLQRQKEMEARRRTGGSGGGPMKLGAKKV